MIKSIIGFTGTRCGMSANQKIVLRIYLENIKQMSAIHPDWKCEFHHGGCRGADEEAGAIAWELGYIVHVHPANMSDSQYFGNYHFLHPSKPPLVRNHDIADVCAMLFAAPLTDTEVLRSGTWATIRYAEKTVAENNRECIHLRR